MSEIRDKAIRAEARRFGGKSDAKLIAYERAFKAAEDKMGDATTHAVLHRISSKAIGAALSAPSQPRGGTSGPSGIVGQGGNDG